jgi:hypothetical protein
MKHDRHYGNVVLWLAVLVQLGWPIGLAALGIKLNSPVLMALAGGGIGINLARMPRFR